MTSVSLLASSTSFPVRAAANVGRMPAAPTMAAITASTSGSEATLSSDSMPARTSVRIPAALISSASCPALAVSSMTAYRG